MGKILATLQQNGASVKPPAPGQGTGEDARPTDDGPLGGVAAPYIEIGPRRQVEASPDVLAAAPPASAASSLPRPHSVQFRNLSRPAGARLAPELVAYHAPGQPAAAEYGVLLPALVEAAQKRAGAASMLLFSGIRPETGSTTVVLNVAITAARQGREVVVVDANLRRPGVARKLGLADAPGLAELLAGECPLDQALRETAVERLTALTAGSPAPFLADLAAVRSLFDVLGRRSMLVLIDGPHWTTASACPALAGMCDVTFLVVPVGEADSPPASALMRDLPQQGVALGGCVLTSP
jgi:Mrp family chromosome partitioning ATPase